MKINGIDAIYYWARDLERARSFYTSLIGAEPSMMVLGSFCEWTFSNGATFGIVKGDKYRQCNGTLFNVADVKTSVDALRAAGVVFDDNGDIEETPVCFMACGNDSEGNGFILHQPK
jgi:predicted enzyme related to lactoylglutathione lyase